VPKDADDFDIATLEIPLARLTINVGDAGKAIDLRGRRSKFLTA
jgi:hypothetical protein